MEKKYLKYKQKYFLLKGASGFESRRPDSGRPAKLQLTFLDPMNPNGTELDLTDGFSSIRQQPRQRPITFVLDGNFYKEITIHNSDELEILRILSSLPPDKQRYFPTLVEPNPTSFPLSEIIKNNPKLTDHYTTEGHKEISFIKMVKIEGEPIQNWSLVTPEQIKQMINIVKILAENGIFDKDFNLGNWIVKPNGEIVRIDFGGVNSAIQSQFSEITGLQEDPEFSLLIWRGIEKPDVDIAKTKLLDDTKLFSEPSLALQMRIYGEMFLILKNKLEYNSFSAKINEDVQKIINGEYENPSLTLLV